MSSNPGVGQNSDQLQTVRVTKKFGFEMAHALWNYDGLCKNVHGHSYKLDVTIIGEPNNDPGDPKQGMVMDFGALKQIVNDHIINRFDHSLIVNEKAPQQQIDHIRQIYERYHIMSQPTCENLVIKFARIIKDHLPDNVRLFRVKLAETDSSYAEWYANDNHE